MYKKNCAPHSVRHSGLPQTCSALIPHEISEAPLSSLTGLVGPVPKGRWLFSWTNRRYGRNQGSLIRTQLETPIKWMKASRFSSSKNVRLTKCDVELMFIVAHDTDGVILHHAVPPRQLVNAAYYCRFLQHHFRSEENDDSWWYRTTSIFMTVQGVTPLLSRTSCAAGNGRFWNIHLAQPIWVHTITISSPKWMNHCEGPGTTQEMNLSVL